VKIKSTYITLGVVAAIASCSSAASTQPVSATTNEVATSRAPVTAAVPAGTAAIKNDAGHNFQPELALLFRVAACGNNDDITGQLPAKDVATVAEHCKAIAKRMVAYREHYISLAKPFFAEVVPGNVPTTVLYPFGGGDLLSALVAFPKAQQITTISLELAGDPRRVSTLTGAQLRRSLGALRGQIGGLLSVGSNTSVNLSAQQRNDLPGQVSSFLLGIATLGGQVTSLRYFRIEADGRLHYITDDEVAQLDARGAVAKAAQRKASWLSPNFAEEFANSEIQFTLPGDAPNAAPRLHRHIGWNLANNYLVSRPELLAHLDTVTATGSVSVVVKGASYLLWRRDFSTIRDYVLKHLAWMVSDSTGIPPRFANAAKLQQTTYGDYDGAFLSGAEDGWTEHSDAFRALWRSQPHRRLAFRFGYVDASKQAHLVVTAPSKK
jgi:hypothetical protein